MNGKDCSLECPIEKTIKFLGQRWTLFILKIIADEKNPRFNLIQKKASKISPRTLAKRLDELEIENYIIRTKFNEMPPRVEYSLTPKGKEFSENFNKLNSIILKWEENKSKISTKPLPLNK